MFTSKRLTIAAIALAAIAAVIWFGVPRIVTALGVHPHYAGPHYELRGKSALIVTTSHATLGNTGKPTGVFASEMTAPYYAFLDGGMTVDIASINGGKVPIDPLSFNWMIEAPADKRFKKDAVFLAKVDASLRVADVDFAKYDIIFLAGGWGAAYDLGPSTALATLITKAWAAGKVVGGICHGPLGLLLAKDETGAPLVRGRRLTGVTDKQVRELGIDITPQHPERELRAAGAKFESRTAFRDFFADITVVDGRLVTGQNQNAGPESAHKMMQAAGGKQVVK
jgi:putative intracellular protease/amidase